MGGIRVERKLRSIGQKIAHVGVRNAGIVKERQRFRALACQHVPAEPRATIGVVVHGTAQPSGCVPEHHARRERPGAKVRARPVTTTCQSSMQLFDRVRDGALATELEDLPGMPDRVSLSARNIAHAPASPGAVA